MGGANSRPASSSSPPPPPRAASAGAGAGAQSGSPQIRCYHCQGIFQAARPAPGVGSQHVRCPYCQTVNGVAAGRPAAATASGPPGSGPEGLLAALASTGALNGPGLRQLLEETVAARATEGPGRNAARGRQEALLRRLQNREVTPLELLVLREFVDHLQQSRPGASPLEIDNHTASWVVDDVLKLPEELRVCCVCLDEVNVGDKVRSLPCLHTFHSACAEEWLAKKKVCPLCNFAIDGSGAAEAAAGGEGAASAAIDAAAAEPAAGGAAGLAEA